MLKRLLKLLIIYNHNSNIEHVYLIDQNYISYDEQGDENFPPNVTLVPDQVVRVFSH